MPAKLFLIIPAFFKEDLTLVDKRRKRGAETLGNTGAVFQLRYLDHV